MLKYSALELDATQKKPSKYTAINVTQNLLSDRLYMLKKIILVTNNTIITIHESLVLIALLLFSPYQRDGLAP
jgi:hypothetical protein